MLLRKEVIQPQVPLRLPCYDFIPVTSYTLEHYLLAVGACASGATGFHDVTGGVYKTRERIHGAVDDAPLLAIPTSWRRVAASNPNWGCFSRFAPPCGIASLCSNHCITSAARGIKGHADLASSSPSSPVREQSRLTLVTGNEGCVRFPT